MALRNLAARMRNPAAAALRLPPPPAPRVSPPAAARPRFYGSFQGRVAYSDEDVRKLYQENLEILDGVKKHEEYLRKRVRLLDGGRRLLKWSYMFLMPLPATATLLRVTNHYRGLAQCPRIAAEDENY